MQVNEKTLNILKNFASIQPNLVVEEGDTIKTMAEARNILASAKLEQSFPCSFGIYDLNEFLSVLSLVDSPTLKFSDEFVTVSDSTGRSRVKYFFADTSILTSPAKTINMPAAEVKFNLDEQTLTRIRRAASALGHDKMTIQPSDGSIILSVIDNNDSTSNSFSIEVPGDCGEETFCFVMNISNLKMISGDYAVSLSSKLLSCFENQSNNDVVYYIALEKSSTYGE